MDDSDVDKPVLAVEVAYGTPTRQKIISLQVPSGTTAYEAVVLSGIVNEFPDIDPDTVAMGIFSKVLDGKTRPTPREYQLQARDRVEIYRPLQIDPKQARLLRAAEAKNKSASKD